MQNDFNSLFFIHVPHADQRVHEERLLRDIGLTRTEAGDLALAEDPSHLVTPPRRRHRWVQALLSWAGARRASRTSASIAARSSC